MAISPQSMGTEALRELETALLLPGLAERFIPQLEATTDPEGVAALCVGALTAVSRIDPAGLQRAWSRHTRHFSELLPRLLYAAPFFGAVLGRHPDRLLWLLEQDLRRPREAADYAGALARELRAVALDERADLLRRFKYTELARITAREMSAAIVPTEHVGEVLHELSGLADALLEHSLESAAAKVAESCGPPQWPGPGGAQRRGFVVLGLGKLGAGELNYSSDVDLIYVYEGPAAGDPAVYDGDKTGPSGLAPAEYFTRVAHEFGRVVSQSTAEGFLYRIDLDLRPEGSAGALVFSSTDFVDYYENWAAVWEKAAFMKARPVAGDHQLGWRVIRALAPIIYRSAIDYRAVAAIMELKGKVESARAREAETFNVKVGSGGIRDIESIAQALQLLNGGRIPGVRGRSTETSLQVLADVGVLPAVDARDLLTAYRFLRRVENRLQMVAERQTHSLPAEAQSLERLARTLGFDSSAAFTAALDAHRRRTRQVFARVFPEVNERILELLARSASDLLIDPTTRTMLETLALQFAQAIGSSANPERALNNLQHFIEGVGRRRFYYELLLDRPELVPRLVALFAASEFFSSYLATHPRLIEPIFNDPNVLVLDRDQLHEACRSMIEQLLREQPEDDTEAHLAALRLFHHRELVNIGLLDLGDKIDRDAVEKGLTELGEVCLYYGLELARRQLERRGAPPAAASAGRFLVVGMGKLATRELTYGSDLDVIFLYDVGGAADDEMAEAQEYFVRLAQKLIWALRTRTAEGICYEIDAALRPSGSQGMLVTSLASLARYHQESAQVWERQALLRARPVAGDTDLGDRFEALRREILARPLPADAEADIRRVRQRTEVELAKETVSRHDFKTGRGGMHDIENIVQLLQLRHGAQHPELFEPVPTVAQLERLAHAGYLESNELDILRQGWEFLQRLSSRLRIVENRSISDLDEERGDLDALARTMGYPPSPREGARRALLEDYRKHTLQIRQVYEAIMGQLP
jgi:glutamate-ammonia-ligase adenylyltransferase